MPREPYRIIRSEIRSAIKSCVDSVVYPDSAVYGIKAHITKVPFYMVVDGTGTAETETNASDVHYLNYFIVAVVRDEDLEMGSISAVDVGGDLIDPFIANHSLNGLVDEVYTPSFDPRYRDNRDLARHWVMIQLTMRKHINRGA